MIIAIDFDGTCVEHKYPEVGNDLPGCVETLKELISMGHKLVLNTMRSLPKTSKQKDTRTDALKWFEDRGIKLSGLNSAPGQWIWTASPKIYANLYIDDAALGCPLDTNGNVDWKEVRKLLGLKEIKE